MKSFFKNSVAAVALFALVVGVVASVQTDSTKAKNYGLGNEMNGHAATAKVFQLGLFESVTPVGFPDGFTGKVKFAPGTKALTRPVILRDFYSGATASFPKGTRVIDKDLQKEMTVLTPPDRQVAFRVKSPALPSGKMLSPYVFKIGSLFEQYSRPVELKIPVADALQKVGDDQIAVLAWEANTSTWKSVQFSLNAETEQVSFKVSSSALVALFKKDNFAGNVKSEFAREISSVKQAQTFFDVSPSHWVYSFAEDLVERGALELGQLFNPDSQITKQSAAVMTLKAFGIQPNGELDTLTGLSGEAKAFIETATMLGILKRNRLGTFNGNETLQKIDALALILKASRLPLRSQGSYFFQDVDGNSWQQPIVNFAVENGIIAKKGRFYPREKVTKAEFVKMLALTASLADRFAGGFINFPS